MGTPSASTAEPNITSTTNGMGSIGEQSRPSWRDRYEGCSRKCREWMNGGALDGDFEHIADLLKKRNQTLKRSLGELAEEFGQTGQQITPEMLFRLAAVDLFVEKAQSVLAARARRMSRAGIATSLTAVAALAALSVYIIFHANVQPSQGEAIDLNELILRVVTAISLGAVVLVAVKYLISLARSFFHESVTLLSRRHALRFGRMYVYLHNGDINLKQLRQAFDWNIGGDSSFLDIRADEIGKTPWSILAKSMGDAVEKGFEKGTDKLVSKLEFSTDRKSDSDTAPENK